MFQDLTQNEINRVPGAIFGKYSMKLEGKSVVPDVIGENAALQYWHFDLQEEPAEYYYWSAAKLLVFLDTARKPFPGGGRPIALAVTFYNTRDFYENDPSCRYEGGPVDFDALRNDTQCLWFDSATAGPNGKPYCFGGLVAK